MTESHRTEEEKTIERWMLTPGSELSTSAIIRYTGDWVRYEDHAREIERLKETLNCPRLTMTAPVEQIKAVLHDWDKGREVNAQDLINALAWRVSNQRREIAKLNEALRRKVSDEAPSFSPNFDERNGIR
jgi:hypothetical protein